MTDRNEDTELDYPPYAEGEHPPWVWPAYRNSVARAPSRFFRVPRTESEASGPVFSQNAVQPGENDLATLPDGSLSVGQLSIVSGTVSDEAGRPIPHTLIEIWQTNSAGRYHHPFDTAPGPLEPGFSGCGRAVTDADGRYRFVTVKPGAYPVPNSGNWWRPPHIHFSLFGPSFMTRLITQLYFPGEPLNALDGILPSVTDPAARERLIARYDPDGGIPERALGYRFDIVLRGRHATPMVG